MTKKKRVKQTIRQDPRTERVIVFFSVEEQKMLDYYLHKHKHSSRSAFIRRLVMTHVVRELHAHTPTLFDQDIIDE